MNRTFYLITIIVVFCSCEETKEGQYANEEFYFELDTLNVSSWSINNVMLDNTKENLSKVGSVIEAGNTTIISRINYGDSSRRSYKRWVNFFGRSDTVFYQINAKLISVGKDVALRFEERENKYSLDYCNLLSSNLSIQTEIGELSNNTKLKDVIERFPPSAKWLNDRVYEPTQYLFDLPEEETASIKFQNLDWLPFSDGKKGTVHLLFSKNKLVFVKRNWSDI